ncbi:MAG TPA: tRNA lysidine(34) synthetase TilS [Acidimicrobiales bacterium]
MAAARRPPDRHGMTTALATDPEVRSLIERCTFPPSRAAVTCAVSGGADSLALLVLAVAAGCEVTAVHVDHGLRPGSDAEGEVVRAAAERFGAAYLQLRVEVGRGPNLEARAREARFAALPPGALTGHTADDQAETVLLNLLRGSGLDGLAGMAPTGHPLLGLRRRETVALCAHLGLRPVADPTNADPALRRNRVRHELLPLLDRIAERDVAGLLARQAQTLRDEADLLDVLAAGIDPTDARALVAAPLPLARRAVRRWLADPYPPDAAAVERVLAIARGDAVACELSGGRRVRRSAQRLWLSSPE